MIFYDSSTVEDLEIPVGLCNNIGDDPNLTPENIKDGVTIYGTTGTYTGSDFIIKAWEGELTDLRPYSLDMLPMVSDRCNHLFFGLPIEYPPTLSPDCSVIGDMGSAFMNTNIKYIDLGNVKSIGVNGLSTVCSNAPIEYADLGNVTNVGKTGMLRAFNYCRDLKSVDLHNLERIGHTGLGLAFEQCSSLTDIDMSKLESIDNYGLQYTFLGCVSLKSADLRKLKTIGYSGSLMGTFENCSSLSEIWVGFTSWPGCTNGWVNGVAETGVFHCPAGLYETFGVNSIPVGWTVVHDVI